MKDLVALPEVVMEALNDPASVKVLATKTPEGVVHAVPLGSLAAPDPNTIVFGVVFMKQTHINMEKMKKKGESPAVLIVNGRNAYQVHATIKDFKTSGPVLDMMNEKVKARGITVTGVWFMEPGTVYDQSPGPNVGKRLA
ncbi:MAG: pyridoxamine 5'-phosphate oxidase family protein [Methanomassiliicoccales archaeon]